MIAANADLLCPSGGKPPSVLSIPPAVPALPLRPRPPVCGKRIVRPPHHSAFYPKLYSVVTWSPEARGTAVRLPCHLCYRFRERYDFVFVPNNVIPFSTLSRGSGPSTLYAYLCAVSSFTHQISSKNEHFPAPWREPRDATWTNQISKPLPSEFPVAGIYYVRFVRIL